MPMPRLTLRSVEIRAVSLPLKRPVVSKVGRFDRWPLVLIDLHTEEGIIGCSYLEPYLERSVRYLVPAIRDLAEARKGRPGTRKAAMSSTRGRASSPRSPGGATPISHSLPPSAPRHWVTRRCRAIRVKPSPTCGRCMIHSRGSPLLKTSFASLAEASGS